MIDLSDGLSRDLPHLLAPSASHPQLGAKINPDAIPIHPDAVTLSQQTGKSPLHHALHDGEDYELLFTSPVQPPAGIRIGTVTDTPGIFLGDDPLPPDAWEHAL
jgi:thiamine-monophosphate kinase